MRVDENMLYKKHEKGMFVSTGARAKLMEKPEGAFYEHYVAAMIREAEKLPLMRRIKKLSRGMLSFIGIIIGSASWATIA